MVGSLLKKANLSTSHRPTTCATIFLICWRCLALAPWNRESESSGSEPVYRKLFSHGPHSSKNNFFGIKISRPTPWVSLSVLLWLLAVNFSPELLLLFLDITLSGLVKISKTNYRWSGIFADVAARQYQLGRKIYMFYMERKRPKKSSKG